MAKKDKKKKKRENATDDFSLDVEEGLDLEEDQEDDDDLYFDGEEIKFWAEIIILILFIAALTDGVFGFKVIKTLMASV
jgi:hypothetical protein